MKDFTPLDRHEYIFKKILNNEQLVTTEIAEYLDVTRKTIERDLKEWISPIFEKDIYIENKNWIIPESIIDITYYEPNELASIAFIFKYMNKDNPKLYNKTVNLFNELHEKVSHSIYKQSSIEDILSIKKEEFYLLKNSIDTTKEIKFKFFGHDKHVQPLKIANLEKYWYLLCFDLNENRFSKYPLNGISEIEILTSTFNLEKHKYLNKLSNAINAFFDVKEEIDIVLKLDWNAKNVLSRKKLNETQNIYKNDDDEYIMNITITNLMEIIPTIQQWIPLIEVISPDNLKEKIKENLENYNL